MSRARTRHATPTPCRPTRRRARVREPVGRPPPESSPRQPERHRVPPAPVGRSPRSAVGRCDPELSLHQLAFVDAELDQVAREVGADLHRGQPAAPCPRRRSSGRLAPVSTVPSCTSTGGGGRTRSPAAAIPATPRTMRPARSPLHHVMAALFSLRVGSAAGAGGALDQRAGNLYVDSRGDLLELGLRQLELGIADIEAQAAPAA